MVDQVWEGSAEQGEGHPIPIERYPSWWTRNVVEGLDSVPASVPKCLPAVVDESCDLPPPGCSDVFEITGKTCIHMMDFNTQFRPSAQSLDDVFDHLALPMVRRRDMGEDQQFHPGIQS